MSQKSHQQIKVKPVIVLGRGQGWFCRSDGSLELVGDEGNLALRVTESTKELRKRLQSSATLLEDTVVRNETDLVELKREALEADALLVYVIGVMPLQTLFHWGLPLIAFSGQYTPMLALYAFGVERHSQPGITIALDFQDIDNEIQLLGATKKLRNARVALFGFPPPLFSRWHHLPDLELASEKLGVSFTPIEITELVARVPMIEEGEAQKLAQRWLQEAKDVIEPSRADVIDVARLFITLANILEQGMANAMAINCLELMRLKGPPPCYAMARLRDEGIPAACEADVSALLTMMLLGYLANAPAFMGNVVGANPETNTLKISHCVVPTRMAGFDQPPRRYTLRNYHGSRGVTAHVELDIGQDVTIARLARSMDKIMLLRGELVDCRDTTACRTTISLRVSDVREFVHRAFGNHHAIVYGNHTRQTKSLSRVLGIGTVEL